MTTLFILSRPPKDPLNKSVIDMIFSSAAFGQCPTLVFCGDAVSLLSESVNSEASLPLTELKVFGIESVYVLSETASAVVDEQPIKDSCIPASMLTHSKFQELIRTSQTVQSF